MIRDAQYGPHSLVEPNDAAIQGSYNSTCESESPARPIWQRVPLTCSYCNGTGRISMGGDDNGVCFMCRGTGLARPHEPQPSRPKRRRPMSELPELLLSAARDYIEHAMDWDQRSGNDNEVESAKEALASLDAAQATLAAERAAREEAEHERDSIKSSYEQAAFNVIKERDEALAAKGEEAERLVADRDALDRIAYNAALAAKERQEQRAFELARELVEVRAAKQQAETLLKELADELYEWVENHYQHTKDHGLRRHYERDMEPVHRTRALLYSTTEPAKSEEP